MRRGRIVVVRMIAARRHRRVEGMDEAVWRLWMLVNLARLALERLLVPPLILPLLPMAVESMLVLLLPLQMCA